MEFLIIPQIITTARVTVLLFQVGWTPLMIGVSAGRVEAVSLLFERGCDVNVVNSTGQTPMHYAASKNRLQV